MVKKFLTSRLFLKNFGLALLIIFVLSWIIMFSLSIYTNKGKNIPVPDFTGLNMLQVNQIAGHKTLRVMVHDSVYRPGIKAGTVLLQNPLPGRIIKPGRMIYLTVVSSSPEKVEVPKLTDISLRQARVLLESRGFAFGKVEFRPSEFEGLVLDQLHNGIPVPPGAKLDNGSTIDLVVGGRGIGAQTNIPDLTGLTIAQAKDSILKKFLTPGAVIFDTSVHTAIDTIKAVVFRQLPSADSSKYVNPGSSIDLWLKTEPKDTAHADQ